ncbi:MAG: transcriptional regulator domain-containing protein [Erythrobacter sp.]
MVRPRDRSAHYARHDFPDFAQEFLRRNTAYRAQHAEALRSGDAGQLARTWGLHFPGRSG